MPFTRKIPIIYYSFILIYGKYNDAMKLKGEKIRYR